MPEDIRNLIARSSLGGAAWCSNCDHPDLLHEEDGCMGDVKGRDGDLLFCTCREFRPQTPAEWRRRHG